MRALTVLGADVHAVQRSPAEERPTGPVPTWQADLADPEQTRRLVGRTRPEVVFHLAGRASSAGSVNLVLPTFVDNLGSTVNLLTTLAETGSPRVVLAGSIEEADRGSPPASPYAASKRAASDYAQMFHGLWNLPTVVLQVSMVYGPAQPDSRKLIPHVINSLLDDVGPALGSGAREIDWVYVDDVVQAFLGAAVAPGAGGRKLEIGSGTAVSIRRTVEMIAEIVGSPAEPRFGDLPDRILEKACIADPRDARAALGWAPTTSLEHGLRETVKWHRSRRGQGA